MVYFKDLNSKAVANVLENYGIQLICLEFDSNIPHSFWGAPEAGRMGNHLYIRDDTPVHSILHESGHYICMPEKQRSDAQVDAKGSTMEEIATCYIQILLADHIYGYNRYRLMHDMDTWGYSFRLGSANSWFNEDAKEVKNWLINHGIINHHSQITWQLRK